MLSQANKPILYGPPKSESAIAALGPLLFRLSPQSAIWLPNCSTSTATDVPVARLAPLLINEYAIWPRRIRSPVRLLTASLFRHGEAMKNFMGCGHPQAPTRWGRTNRGRAGHLRSEERRVG